MAASTPMRQKPQPSKVFCDHCKDFVGRSTYYRHRSRYYDPRKKSWVSALEQRSQTSSSDSSAEVEKTPEEVCGSHPDPNSECR